MKFKHKAAIMIIISAIFLIFVTYLIFNLSYFGFIKNYKKFEIDNHFLAVIDIIRREETSLNSSLMDWAYWDDTYKFIEDENSDYIESNLQKSSLVNLNIDLMIFINSNNKLVYNIDKDIGPNYKNKLTDYFLSNVNDMQNLTEAKSGLIRIDDRTYIVGISPIYDTNRELKSKGTLICIRRADAKLTEYINKILNVNVNFSTADASISNSSVPSAAMISSDFYSTKFNKVIKDINGENSIVLTIIINDNNYKAITRYLFIFVLCFALMLIIIFFINYFLVNKYYFNRLLKLTNFANKVAITRDTSMTIELKGDDELQKVAGSINKMLSALDTAYKDISIMENRYRLLMEATNDGYLDYYVETKEMYISSEWSSLIGYEGQTGQELFEEYMSKIHPDCRRTIAKKLHELTIGKEEYFEEEYRIVKNNGDIIWVLHRGKAVQKNKNNRAVRIISTLSNITDRKNKEKEILFLSYSDKLTGLRNRAFMEDQFNELDESEKSQYFIIMGDLNGLKITNDTFGHYEGDRLICAVSKVLKDNCSSSEIVSRWGGDEFVILLNNSNEAHVVVLIHNIRASISKLDDFQFNISIALGYAEKNDINNNSNAVMSLAENRMYRNKLMENTSSRNAGISSLARTLHEKSSETEEHTMRIKNLCLKLGEKLGLSQDKLDELELLSLLHDIGKIGIPEQILMKPSKLTDEEWAIMKTHTEIGYRIAKSSPELEHIADKILAHHEKYNGTGYPNGIKGEKIPYISRIINVVDSFDVMTHSRIYKQASDINYAIDELKRCSGTQFDPYIVNNFLQLLNDNEIEIEESQDISS